MCIFQVGRSTTLLEEGVTAVQQLRRVMMPVYPVTLLANTRALENLANFPTGTWDRSRELQLDSRIRALDRGRSIRGARPYLYKLSCLLQSDFNRTLFLDCDVFVLLPSLLHDVFMRVLTVADVAMPIDPGREPHLAVGTPPWASSKYSGPPPLCSAILAYSKSPSVDQLWVGAAQRLMLGTHPEVRQGDQEMIWFQWTQSAMTLRVLPLPEEYLCPLESRQQPAPVGDKLRPPVWRTPWRRGVYQCHAVHGHRYAQSFKMRPI